MDREVNRDVDREAFTTSRATSPGNSGATGQSRTSSEASRCCDPSVAAERLELMLSCWRTARAAEPELYTRALMSVLLHYPDFVVIAVTEPATGIASKLKKLRDGRKISIPPDVAELVDACDAIHEPVRRRLEREAIARMAARGLPPPRCARTPEEQAAVDAQIERVRQMFGIPAGGLVRRSGGGQGVLPRARDLASMAPAAAAVLVRAAPRSG